MKKAVKIRNKLTTASGREAFDKVSALGAHWDVVKDKSEAGGVYVSLRNVDTKEVDDVLLRSVDGSWGATLDEAVVGQQKKLAAAATERSNTIVVVNAEGGAERAEYRYDAQTREFSRYARMKESADLRDRLTTASAKKAFDRVSALGARWLVAENPNEVSVSLDVVTQGIDDTRLHYADRSRAATLDEAVVDQERKLAAAASQPDTLVVVNPHRLSIAEFTYDQRQRKFKPFSWRNPGL